MITDLKVELEGIKQNLNTVDTIHGRLDNAIVQLTTVATDVKSMLAVHEEKLHRAEKVDDLIFQKFRDKQEEMDKIYTDLKRDAEVQEQRIMNELKALHISVNRLKDDTA